MSRDLKAVLVHWITQRKLTTRELASAKEDMQLWLKRAKLALDTGRVDLAKAAKEQAIAARDTITAKEMRLLEIESELEAARAGEPSPGTAAAEAALERAAHAADEFQKLGIDTRFAGLENAATVAPTADQPAAETRAVSAPPPEQSALDEAEALLAELYEAPSDDADIPQDS